MIILFPVPCSLFPVPCSLLPTPYSLLPVPLKITNDYYQLLDHSAKTKS
ncbi:MAG: hypothetical protein F6K56_08925 [Moorea sp. SIO3G5]|nr:hypothetical protein [Moorena sp. SIO3G5]